MSHTDTATHTPSIAFHHLPPKEGCRKPVLGVWQQQRPELSPVILINSLVCWFCTSCLSLFLFQRVTPHDEPNTVLKFDVTSRCLDSKLYANWFHTVMNPWPWSILILPNVPLFVIWLLSLLPSHQHSNPPQMLMHELDIKIILVHSAENTISLLDGKFAPFMIIIACTERLADNYTSMLCYMTGRSSSNCLPFLEWSSLLSSKLWTVCLFVIVFWFGKRWWL